MNDVTLLILLHLFFGLTAAPWLLMLDPCVYDKQLFPWRQEPGDFDQLFRPVTMGKGERL